MIKRKIEQAFTSTVFSRILYKINFTNQKGTKFLLSVDLLKDSVKKELLKLTIKNLEKTYQDLFERPNYNVYMEKNGQRIFLQFLKKTCQEFLEQQYGHKLNINRKSLKTNLYTIKLLSECKTLFEVPFYALIDPGTPFFKKIYYPIYSYASDSFIEALLDNLIIEVSNCIVYFSIVTFSFLYTFRQILYKTKFLSLRNFENFRNNLIWQIRLKNYFQTPLDLYNNCYRIYIIRTSGIYYRVIYANRSTQLASLRSLPLIIISFAEIKDFLQSRLDESIYFLSNGIRFSLTSVLGKVIGLLWRGIIEGLKK